MCRGKRCNEGDEYSSIMKATSSLQGEPLTWRGGEGKILVRGCLRDEFEERGLCVWSVILIR